MFNHFCFYLVLFVVFDSFLAIQYPQQSWTCCNFSVAYWIGCLQFFSQKNMTAQRRKTRDQGSEMRTRETWNTLCVCVWKSVIDHYLCFWLKRKNDQKNVFYCSHFSLNWNLSLFFPIIGYICCIIYECFAIHEKRNAHMIYSFCSVFVSIYSNTTSHAAFDSGVLLCW